MRTVKYHSIYKPLIKEFITLKRNLGYKYNGIEYPFMKFDQLVCARKETTVGISKDLSDVWCTPRPNESERTRINRIQFLREFSSFLNSLDYPSFKPRLPKIRRGSYKPYIYTKEEVAAIFRTADQMCSAVTTRQKQLIVILPALFRLLYGTGMRVGEALSLSYKDVHLEEQYMVLRDTKNGSDRMVPLSDSLTEVMGSYMDCRMRFPMIKPTELVFIHPNGDSCTIASVYMYFKQILYKIGIPHRGRHLGPHVHNLRHTFSVHSLAKMAEAGTDLYYSLPILSTYLGHKSVRGTDGYVRLTADMYPSVTTKVNDAFPYLFPQLYKDESRENC